MPASRKRSQRKGSRERNSKAAFAAKYGDWVNVWHGVKVVAPVASASPQKFFSNQEIPSEKRSFLSKLLKIPRLGFFPKLHAIENPRSPHKDLLYILLNMRWTMLLAVLLSFYFAVILFFGVALLACGEALAFFDSFNLSFHTFATIGYGHLIPSGRCANYIVTIEAFSSMVVLSMITGLVFAKFAKPKAKVAFSKVCVIQPYGEKHLALVMRTANATHSTDVRHDVIMEASFRVTLLRIEKLRRAESELSRPSSDDSLFEMNRISSSQDIPVTSMNKDRMPLDSSKNDHLVLCSYDLDLVQSNFITFRMGVALVHVIDENSPFYGMAHDSITKSDMILHLVMSGVDSTLQDTVTESCIYTATDIRWGEKFKEMLDFDSNDRCVVMDFAKLSLTNQCPIDEETYIMGNYKVPPRKGHRYSSISTANSEGTWTSRLEDIEVETERLSPDDSPEQESDKDMVLEESIPSDAVTVRYRPLSHRSSFSMEPLFEPLLQHPVGTQRIDDKSLQPDRLLIQKFSNHSICSNEAENSKAVAYAQISPRQMHHMQGQLTGTRESDSESDETTKQELRDVIDELESGLSSPRSPYLDRKESTMSVKKHESIPRFVRITPKNIPGRFTVLSLYYKALHVKWIPIFCTFVLGFFAINFLFGLLYFAQSGSVLVDEDIEVSMIEACFFLSVHTISTIGYGSIIPSSNYLNFLVTVEATIGLITVTLLTGISWSKFARPRAHILFSKNISITHLYGYKCLVFRAANTRHHGDIRDSTFRIGVLLTDTKTGLRHLYNVPLVTAEWPSFSLSTTLIHVIDKSSPFANIHCKEDISCFRVALIALFTGLDTTFSESVYARKMYFWDDFVFNMHFEDTVAFSPDRVTMDFRTFDSLVPDCSVI